MKPFFYAHSIEETPPDQWQTLETHLCNVAELCRKFADKFGSREWGYIEGLWHDLGKYLDDFQKRLKGENVSVEHSGVGACLAYELWEKNGLPVAFAIAGHHGGLPNLQKPETGLPLRLKERIEKNKTALNKCRHLIADNILNQSLPPLPFFLETDGRKLPNSEKEHLVYAREMWVRFLFSCLVDADRLDTAFFCTPEREKKRGGYADIQTLKNLCDNYINKKTSTLSPEQKNHRVNQARLSILKQCRNAAQKSPGIFSLTVPTGGGKTLSGMSFALNHAATHGLQRVIVVIPYTSIIEQNARVYRECLGAENVLEHHASLDPEKEEAEKGIDTKEKHEAAAENWDAPVVVTTTVQFFETLFSSKPSKARKLHNISNSVIILDEVQSLPPGMLNPILNGLTQLSSFYNCSIVLSTATPPALAARKRFEQGLPEVVPIISDPKKVSEKLKRVEFNWPERHSSPRSTDELAAELNPHHQVLCIVHRRKDARELAQKLEAITGEPVFHLSALMCPAHRLLKIEQIQESLHNNESCRVVSTQLIEAGVDLDFPIVYRALAGLDSIVQAGGRCNREGRMKCGKLIVFKSASKPPPGVPQKSAAIMESLLREFENKIYTEDPDMFEYYFKQLYFHSATDVKNIQANRRAFNYATVGRDFKLIEDGFTHTVIVPWGDSENRLSSLRQAIDYDLPTKNHLRALQPFTINIYQNSFKNLCQAGAVEELIHGVFTLLPTHKYLYDEQYGLIEGDEPPAADPESLIVGI